MTEKLLGHKAYKSIPHLPSSKAEGDRRVNEGQAKIVTDEEYMNRKQYDNVIIQLKYDGSNVSIVKKDNEIIPINRAGYPVYTSPYKMHQYFGEYVDYYESMFDSILNNGERLCGEWLLQAHGIKYDISTSDRLFIPFDICYDRYEHLPYYDFRDRIESVLELILPTIVNIRPEKPENLTEYLHNEISIIPESKHEGFVYRAEKNDQLMYMTKWVQSDFEAGKYLSEDDPVWNIDPDELIYIGDEDG